MGAKARQPAWADRLPSPRACAIVLSLACCVLTAERRFHAIRDVSALVYSRLTRAEVCGVDSHGRYVPPDVERHEYRFPETRWAGDEAFYSQMPCPPSSYRVVMPAGHKGAGRLPAPGCDDGPTVVTAFFDIGRGKWAHYKRDSSYYTGEAAKMTLTVKNRLVVFTSPELVDEVVQKRAELGLADRTIVVGMAHRCVPAAELYNRTAEVMCNPRALDGFFDTRSPEQRFMWYNILMWAKIKLVKAATVLPQVAVGYTFWLDFGCHWPQCREKIHSHTCFNKYERTNSSRIRAAFCDPLTPYGSGLTDAEWSHHKKFIIAGPIFAGGDDAIARGEQLFMDKVENLLDQGIADQDQLVWTLVYRENPDAFEPVYVAGEWQLITEWVLRPPDVPASHMRPERGVDLR